MRMQRIYRTLLATVIVCTSIAVPVALFAASAPATSQALEANGHYYDCNVKVYVVEPNSRWTDNVGFNYQYGLLGTALDANVTLVNQTPYTNSVTWTGSAHGYGDITEGNIMVIAVVSSVDSYTGYSDPPSGNPFDVYNVQATAAATPGETGHDDASAPYTHTAFMIEGSQHTCVNCPLTRFALEEMYGTGNYPFHYAAFVEDMNSEADDYLHNDYNILGFPTAYTDGGYRVNVGGTSDTSVYGQAIRDAASNAVHDLDLAVTLTWLGSSQLQVDVELASNELSNTAPGAPATPTGPSEVPKGTVFNYVTSATDVDGDSLWYQWCISGLCFNWMGPYASGDTCMLSRAFNNPGDIGIFVKAKDLFAEGPESDSLTITVGDYICGDANADGTPNITDAVVLIQWIFAGGAAPDPLAAGDANCDGTPNITDAVHIIQWIFAGGAAPCSNCD